MVRKTKNSCKAGVASPKLGRKGSSKKQSGVKLNRKYSEQLSGYAPGMGSASKKKGGKKKKGI